MANTGKHCSGTNKQGHPCQSPAVEGSKYCYFHDPALAGKRARARKRGGKGRAARRFTEQVPANLRNMAGIMGYLEHIADNLGRLENGVSRARAQTALAQAALKAIELNEIEERLQALENAIGAKHD